MLDRPAVEDWGPPERAPQLIIGLVILDFHVAKWNFLQYCFLDYQNRPLFLNHSLELLPNWSYLVHRCLAPQVMTNWLYPSLKSIKRKNHCSRCLLACQMALNLLAPTDCHHQDHLQEEVAHPYHLSYRFLGRLFLSTDPPVLLQLHRWLLALAPQI